jgi:hypothetical protein
MVGSEKGASSPETDILGVMLLLAQGADPNTAIPYAINANSIPHREMGRPQATIGL